MYFILAIQSLSPQKSKILQNTRYSRKVQNIIIISRPKQFLKMSRPIDFIPKNGNTAKPSTRSD